MVTPDMIAAVFVPSAAVFAIALCFRTIREAFASRLRGGREGDELELAILSEIRTLRSEVYALRLEVAANGSIAVAPPGMRAGAGANVQPGIESGGHAPELAPRVESAP